VLDNIRLERFVTYETLYLIRPFVSYKENEVL